MNKNRNSSRGFIGVLIVIIIALLIIWLIWQALVYGPTNGLTGNLQSNGNTNATSTEESTTTNSNTYGTKTFDLSASSSPVVSQDFNGKIVIVKKNQRFLLELGNLEWSLSFSPLGIVSRVPNISVVRGAQGIYTATSVGTTTLSAEGRPICPEGGTCPQFMVKFTTTIVVK